MKIVTTQVWGSDGSTKIEASIIDDDGKTVLGQGFSYDNPHYYAGPIKATTATAVQRALDNLEVKLAEARKAAVKAELIKL